MQPYPCLLAIVAGLAATSLPPLPAAPAAPSPAPTGESVVGFSVAGRGGIAEGSRSLGDLRGRHGRAGVSWTAPLDAQSAWLLGADWQQFDFDAPAGAPIPKHLTALSLKLGYNRELTPQWSLRATIEPGSYATGRYGGRGAFSVPATLRLFYAVDRDRQWIAGIDIDPRSGTPVLGGGGLRWKFADAWTLLLVVPTPRIEYTLSPQVALFAAGGWRSMTFRVADDFGRRCGRPLLDAQNVGYREIDLTVGLRWQVAPALSVRAAAGWMIDRRLEFSDRNLLLNGAGAPGFQLSLSGSF